MKIINLLKKCIEDITELNSIEREKTDGIKIRLNDYEAFAHDSRGHAIEKKQLSYLETRIKEREQREKDIRNYISRLVLNEYEKYEK